MQGHLGGHAGDYFDDLAGVWIGMQSQYKGAIDFDLVWLQRIDQVELGVAGAEVIQRQLDARGA